MAFVEPDSLLLEEAPELVACDDEATELAGSDGVLVELCSFVAELAVCPAACVTFEPETVVPTDLAGSTLSCC